MHMVVPVLDLRLDQVLDAAQPLEQLLHLRNCISRV